MGRGSGSAILDALLPVAQDAVAKWQSLGPTFGRQSPATPGPVLSTIARDSPVSPLGAGYPPGLAASGRGRNRCRSL